MHGGATAEPERGGRRGRRAAAADLHVLSSGAGAHVSGGADAAPARRAHDRRDRARVSGSGSDDGAAAGASQRQDSRRADSVPRARTRPTSPLVCAAVLAVVYLVFNEGYTASSGERLVREDLCAEAIRLGRQLHELMPDEPEVMGLLALMLLIESRRTARVSADGDLVLLPDQDRSRWNRALITEGQAHRPAVPRAQSAGSVSDSSRHQRRPQRRGVSGRHRLAADPDALQPPHVHRTESDRGPQPCRRGR